MDDQRVVGIDHKTRGMIRRAIMLLLDDMGYGTEIPQDPFQWLTGHPASQLLVAIPQRTPPNIRAARASAPHAIIVGVCDQIADTATFRQYLGAGANSIIRADTPSDTLKHALAVSLRGLAVLPGPTARAILRRLEEPPASLNLTERDTRLLSLIAQGATPTAAAAEIGCSHRHLRRITSALLNTIGADNRAHAAALATRWGLAAMPP
ncbi:MAG: hypothetical protein R2823_10810 [Acidimicrobiia bacterium]